MRVRRIASVMAGAAALALVATMTAAVVADSGARGRLSDTVLAMVVLADLVEVQPDGAFVLHDGAPKLVLGDALLPGRDRRQRRDVEAVRAEVLLERGADDREGGLAGELQVGHAGASVWTGS